MSSIQAKTYEPVPARTVAFLGLGVMGFPMAGHLARAGHAVTVLDGQAMRQGISRDLGFSADERSENLRRSAEVAKLFNDAGMICLAAFVAPDASVRERVAERIGRDRFLVVHLATPVDVCRTRDTSGVYARADRGEITDFPGLTAPYEPPVRPDLTIPGPQWQVERGATAVIEMLETRGFL